MADKRSIELTDGVQIPLVGFGTYLISDADASAAVSTAIRAGYRHIDTAEAYQNEQGVGAAIHECLKHDGISREEIFVTTKLWPGNAAWGETPKSAEATVESLNASLARLQLDYIDLYLIHAPFHRQQRLEQWRGLVELREQGKARAIGVSNFSEAHIEELRAAAMPLPDANQIELHPWSQKPALVSYLAKNGITAIAYSSLVPLSTWRSAEGHDSAKTEQMQADGESSDSPLRLMAEKYAVSEAQLLLRWGVQMSYPVLPKSTNPDRLRKNMDLFSFAIDASDMAAIRRLDRGDGVAWSMGDPTKAL